MSDFDDEIKKEEEKIYKEIFDEDDGRKKHSKHKTKKARELEEEEEKHIHIKISVNNLVKVLVALLLITGFFLLGRYVFPSPDLVDFAGKSTEKVFVCPDDTEVSSKNLCNLETTSTNSTNQTTETDDEEEDEEEEEEEEPQQETTSTTTSASSIKNQNNYSKISLAINSAGCDWLDTWGHINDITITVKNNEAVPIRPTRLEMTVEGYDDPGMAAKGTITLMILEPKATSKKTKVVFSNSHQFLGDDSREISVRLFDSFGTLMTTTDKIIQLGADHCEAG